MKSLRPFIRVIQALSNTNKKVLRRKKTDCVIILFKYLKNEFGPLNDALVYFVVELCWFELFYRKPKIKQGLYPRLFVPKFHPI